MADYPTVEFKDDGSVSIYDSGELALTFDTVERMTNWMYAMLQECRSRQ